MQKIAQKVPIGIRSFIRWVKNNLVLFFTVLAAVLGIGFGFLLRKQKLSSDAIEFITFPGELLLRSLYMIVPLLIVSSIISGLNGKHSANMGSIGWKLFIYYGCTTLVAALIGIGMSYIIRAVPFIGAIAQSEPTGKHTNPPVGDAILDMLRNLVTSNIVRAMFQSQQTKYKLNEDASSLNTSNTTLNHMVKYQAYADGTNMVGIIFFSILFGIALKQVGEKARPMADIFYMTNETVLEMVNIIMIYSPIGIFFLILGSIAGIAEANERIVGVIYLSLAHVLGIFIHWTMLSCVYIFFTRKNPLRFIFGLKDTLIAAWGIMSSTSVLPLTMRCMEKKNHVGEKYTRLILPIGATVNMDGNSMHFVQVAFFIAQIHGIPISFVSLITIVLTSSLASVGLAAVPNSFFAAVLIILEAVHLPSTDVVLMFTTEWILDRFRTALNVYGDCVGAAIIEESEKGNDGKQEVQKVQEDGEESKKCLEASTLIEDSSIIENII